MKKSVPQALMAPRRTFCHPPVWTRAKLQKSQSQRPKFKESFPLVSSYPPPAANCLFSSSSPSIALLASSITNLRPLATDLQHQHHLHQYRHRVIAKLARSYELYADINIAMVFSSEDCALKARVCKLQRALVSHIMGDTIGNLTGPLARRTRRKCFMNFDGVR